MLLKFPTHVYSLEDYVTQQLHSFQISHQSVGEKHKASRKDTMGKQHAQANPVTLTIGNFVMKSPLERQYKLNVKLSKPHTLYFHVFMGINSKL